MSVGWGKRSCSDGGVGGVEGLHSRVGRVVGSGVLGGKWGGRVGGATCPQFH